MEYFKILSSEKEIWKKLIINNTIMKVILLFLFSTFCYAQDMERELTTGALDIFFKANSTGLKHNFKYTLENSLNWEINIDTKKNSIQSLENSYYENLRKGSKDIIILSLIQIYDLKLYTNIIQDCKFKYVIFKVIYRTSDGGEISFYYKISINDLLYCRYNLIDKNCKDLLYSIQN